MTTFILVGPHAGKDITLGGRRFVGGRHHFEGSPEEVGRLVHTLGQFYSAHPEGPLAEAAAQEYERGKARTGADPQPAAVQPVGGPGEGASADRKADDGAPPLPEGSAPSAPDGASAPTEVRLPGVNAEKLKASLLALDPANDDHWTQIGRPSLTAVAEIYGGAGLKRADLEAVLPGYNRKARSASA